MKCSRRSLEYRLFLHIAAFLFLLSWPLPGVADTASGRAFRLWQAQDGLPENTVQAFAQTPDGYLWIGTSGGLSRFDGDKFTVFDSSNTAEFQENSVLCLLAARDGSLWIGTDGGGLIHWKDGNFFRYSAPQGMEAGFVRSLFEDREGRLWVGTDDGLYRPTTQPGRLEKIPGLPETAVLALGEDLAGRLWLGGNRLFVLDSGRFQQQALPGHAADSHIRSILTAPDGSLWVGSSSGLSRKLPGDAAFHPVPGIQAGVRLLLAARDGTLYIATSGEGVFSLQNGKLSLLQGATPVSTNSLLALFQDRNESLWLGTQAGMIQRLRSSVSIVHLPATSNADFGTIYMDTDGSLWSASRRLFHIREGVPTPVNFPALRGATVQNVLRDIDGTLWLGTNGSGIFHILPGRTLHYTVQQGLVNNFIRILTQGQDGSIWIGTEGGVSRLHNGQFRSLTTADGLCYPSIQAIVEDLRGDIWIGTSLGLSHLHNGALQQDEITRRLRREKVWSMNVTPQGELWIGTRNGGLYGYDQSRILHFTTAQGLASDSIYKILGDGRGFLWFSGPGGVSRVSIDELNAQARGELQEVSPRFYYIADGRETVQFYGGMQSGGTISPNGDAWFPSNHGPVRILPGDDLPPLPVMRITRALADGKSAWAGNVVNLPPENSSLEIAYAPILLTPQIGIRYRYRLEGLDTAWTNVMGRRTAYFTHLPPGRYVFKVQGYDTNRPDARAEASLVILKRPYFYRTWWFLTLAAGSVALLLWGIHRLRLRSLHLRFRAILEERSRLAREMHDTLIQGCASVSSLLEASSGPEAEPHLRQELVDYARAQMSVTMDEARRAVWNLRQVGEEQSDVRQSIAEMAERTSAQFGIPVRCRFFGDRTSVNAPSMHEVTMIAREAVYNSLIHGAASRIEVDATLSPTTIELSIRDDGRGFDPATVVSEGHYGLVGMQERVKRLGGTFQLHTSPGRGTQVSFSVPAQARKAGERVA